MLIVLTEVSPVSFLMASECNWLKIRKTVTKCGEYIDRINSNHNGFLVFKGKTKIGMIPRENNHKINTERCQIVGMDKTKNIIIIRI